jgi:hypothetical protein
MFKPHFRISSMNIYEENRRHKLSVLIGKQFSVTLFFPLTWIQTKVHVLWLLKNEMETITIVFLVKSNVDIVGFVAKYEEMTELWKKIESAMIQNEYKAVSLRHHYSQEYGGLLRRLLMANAPSRHYGKSMGTTSK